MGITFSKNIDIDPEKKKKIIGLVLIAFGLVFLLSVAIIAGREQMIIADSIETTGTVVRLVPSSNSSGGMMFHTQYSYIDKDNNKHVKTGNSASNPPEYKVGDKIKVYYRKGDYDSSIYKSKTNMYFYIIFGIFGTIFLLGGILFTHAYRTGNLFSVDED